MGLVYSPIQYCILCSSSEVLYKASVEASPKLCRLARWLKTSLTVPVPVLVLPLKQATVCCINNTGLLTGFKVSNGTCVCPNAEDSQYQTDQYCIRPSSTAYCAAPVRCCIRRLGIVTWTVVLRTIGRVKP